MEEQGKPDGERIRPLDASRRLWKPSDDGFLEELTTPQRCVLAVLVAHSNQDGLAWPSHATIAKATGLGRSTVIRVLRELEALGAIIRASNPPQSTRYTVPLWDRPALGLPRSEKETVPQRASDRPATGHELLKELPKELDTANLGDPIKALWQIWLEEFGRKPPHPKFTDKRRKKLEALHREHLNQESDPSARFRAICQAVLASDHHMSTRSFQMPESLFLNEERRERWYLQSLDGQRGGGYDRI